MTADLTAYIDLTVYDRDPSELVERAVVDAAGKLPGWVPREGNTEMVLLESMGLQVAELVYAINRVPAAVVEAALRIYGVTRDPGAPPTTTVRFDFLDTLGHTVPAGTKVRFNPGDGTTVIFTTDTDATADPGDSFATVAATGAKNTSIANGIPSGELLDILETLMSVNQAETASTIGNGRDPETARAWLERGIQRFARLNDALVLPLHFTSYALEEPAVARATTIDMYDPATGPDPGDNPGHVTTAVIGPGGTALSGGAKTTLETAMQARASAHLVVHVVDATVNDVDVTVQVARVSSFTDAEVIANVEAALLAYLDPDVWAWGGTVWRNELISIIDQAAGVDRVVTLTTPAADLVLTGVGPLAAADALTVTVA
jgi:uncharacterized phage protein gp47/JayE